MQKISLFKSLLNANFSNNKAALKNAQKYVSISENFNPKLKDTLTEASTTLGNYGKHKGLKISFQPMENDIFDGVRMDVQKIRVVPNTESIDSPSVFKQVTSQAGMAIIDSKGKDKVSFLREIYESLSGINKRVREQELKNAQEMRDFFSKHNVFPG
ncbi:MAG: hypothetical protein KHX03_05045 [Clostridium sp.]|nr:hypothetical protein [Clostridium sp.]